MAVQDHIWHAVLVEFLAIAVCGAFLLYLVLEVVRQPRLFQRMDDPDLGRRRSGTPEPQHVLDLRERAVDAFFTPSARSADRDSAAHPDGST